MIYLKLILTAAFWGGTFISGRLLADSGVHPLASAFLRFLIAGLLLGGLLIRSHGRFPPLPRKLWLPAFLLGLTGVFSYNIFFLWGLQLIPAGRASIIVANNPVLIAIGAALLFRYRLGAAQTLGVALSVAGAVTAVSRGNPISLFSGGLGLGDVLLFGCVLSWASFSLIGKTVLPHIGPLASITYAGLIGAVLLLPPALLSGMPAELAAYSLLDWGNIAYLGVFGTVIGFVWYYQGIETIGPTRAALFINFVPIFAIAAANLFLDEPITWSLAAGGAMVLTGIYLTTNGLTLPGRPPRSGPEHRQGETVPPD